MFLWVTRLHENNTQPSRTNAIPSNTDAAKESDFYTSVFCDSKIEDDTEEDDECSYTFHPGTNPHKATTRIPTSTRAILLRIARRKWPSK